MRAIGIAIALAFAVGSTFIIGALALEGGAPVWVACLCAAGYGLLVVTALVLELRGQ